MSEAALAGPPPPQPPRPSDLLLRGLGGPLHRGLAAGAPILKEALSAFRRDADAAARGGPLALARQLDRQRISGTTRLGRCSPTRQLELVREAGALTALPFVLSTCSSVYAFFGELARGRSRCSRRSRAATEATGIAAVPYGALSLAALRGQEAELSELVRTSVDEARGRGERDSRSAITEFAERSPVQRARPLRRGPGRGPEPSRALPRGRARRPGRCPS